MFSTVGPLDPIGSAGLDFDDNGILHVLTVELGTVEPFDSTTISTIRRFSPLGEKIGTVVLDRPGMGPSDLIVQKRPRILRRAVIDSFLREGAPKTNEGANPRLRIQDAGNNRGLVAFDLQGVQLDHVARATVVLEIAENGDNWGRANNRTIDAHPLLAGFVEGSGAIVLGLARESHGCVPPTPRSRTAGRTAPVRGREETLVPRPPPPLLTPMD